MPALGGGRPPGVVVLGAVGVEVVVETVRTVGSGGRNGNDRSGTATTFPLLSLSRLQGSLCLEGAPFQLGAPSLCFRASNVYAESFCKRINLEATL